MVKMRIILILFMFALTGCDHGYGPSLMNVYQTDVRLKIYYSNGETSDSTWPPCRDSFIGKSDKPSDTIREIVISSNGTVLSHLNAEQVRTLLEKEEAQKGYAAWSFGPNGIELVTSPDTHGCLKGKPVK